MLQTVQEFKNLQLWSPVGLGPNSIEQWLAQIIGESHKDKIHRKEVWSSDNFRECVNGTTVRFRARRCEELTLIVKEDFYSFTLWETGSCSEIDLWVRRLYTSPHSVLKYLQVQGTCLYCRAKDIWYFWRTKRGARQQHKPQVSPSPDILQNISFDESNPNLRVSALVREAFFTCTSSDPVLLMPEGDLPANKIIMRRAQAS